MGDLAFVGKDEYGLVHITYEDPIENHISDNEFNFEIIITKEDNIVHNLKATKNNDTKLWLWQLYHLSGTGSCFWND